MLNRLTIKFCMLLTLFFLSNYFVQAQCPTGDIRFNTQAELDAFRSNHPNCTDLKGSLTIVGLDITDLTPLSNLQAVQGELLISNTDFLTSLEGLSNLQTVGSRFSIVFSSKLTDLDGLSSLTNVGGDLRLFVTDITNVDGLSNLNFVGGDLEISTNPSLTNYDGLCPLFNTGTLIGSLTGGGNGAEFDPAVDCGCPADNTPPVANCKDIEVFLDANGQGSVTPADIDNGSFDNCGPVSFSLATDRDLQQLDFTCDDLNTFSIVILEVTDGRGLSSTCTSEVTFVDNLAPTAHCKNVEVSLDGNGEGSVTPADIDNGSFDNCGPVSFSLATDRDLQQLDFTCDDLNTFSIVILEVTDGRGLSSTCTSEVTITDNIAPVVECKDITVTIGESGQVFYSAPMLEASLTENCSLAPMGYPEFVAICSDAGTYELTYTVKDKAGNIASCTGRVTILPNPANAPVAQCKDLEVSLDANGQAAVTPADFDNGSSGGCGNLAFIFADGRPQLDFTCADVNTARTIELGVLDEAGSVSTCSSQLTIKDNLAPVITCNDITLNLGANGRVTVAPDIMDFQGSDNCSIVSFGGDVFSATCADLGTPFAYTITGTDASGNEGSCTLNVTVEDNLAPTALCKNVEVVLGEDGQASLTPADIDNGSSDNCGPVSFSLATDRDLQQLDFTCDDVNTFSLVILEVTDGRGLSSTCTSEVTITDNLAPVVNCQDITVELDAKGNGSYSADMLDAGVTDNCGLGDNGFPIIPVSCANIGTFEVTYTVKDKVGNEGSCIGNVTVVDKIAPVITCNDITLNLGANGRVTVAPDIMDFQGSDNCSIVSFGGDVFSATCADLGTPFAYTITGTDASGNEGSCTLNVTVEDNLAPTALCKNVEVSLDENGEGRVTPADIDNGSFDNCGPVSFSLATDRDLQQVDFSCDDLNTFSIVILEVTDGRGLSSTCTSEVTFVDNVAPTALCKNVEVSLDGNGEGSVTPADIDNGSFDNCGPVSFSLATDRDLQQVDFSCDDLNTFL